MQKHQANTTESDEQEHNKKVMQFAKDLFASWDDDGSGILDVAEVVKPMVSLGLASDANFTRKIMQALDPRSRAAKAKTDLQITLPDFIKIFKNDKISD